MADDGGWEARMSAPQEFARLFAADLGRRPSAEAPDCPDCGAAAGVKHEAGCDVARCLEYGNQRALCSPGARMVIGILPSGAPDISWVPDGHDCGADIWSGEWPGKAECREFGWWAVFVPNGHPPFVPVPPGTQDAREDLNRLVVEARWDKAERRWMRRG